MAMEPILTKQPTTPNPITTTSTTRLRNRDIMATTKIHNHTPQEKTKEYKPHQPPPYTSPGHQQSTNRILQNHTHIPRNPPHLPHPTYTI